MKTIPPFGFLCIIAITALLGSGPAHAGSEQNRKKTPPDAFNWRNYQSDIAGVGRHVDENVVNPWGLAISTAGTLWVSDNGTGVATVYNQDGTATGQVVHIPVSASNTGGANPTGIVSNPTAFFRVTKNGNTQPSTFIFVSEDGSISGWNAAIDSNNAVRAVDNGATGAVYKGVTLATSTNTFPHNYLYVTNFHSGHVEMYDENFVRVDTPSSFADANIPPGYAPFGIRTFNNQIFVTYALQDANRHDDVPGAGNGFVDVFDANGTLLRRLVSNDRLNSPWGLALATSFGKYTRGGLFVGNFGDGRINIYDPGTGAFVGTLRQTDKTILQFDGLWDLGFLSNQLYFNAGIGGEDHGIFGAIFPGS